MADARVEILIDEVTNHWNHSFIDGIFIPEEVELIKSILLPQQGVEERLFLALHSNRNIYKQARVSIFEVGVSNY